MNLKCSVTIPGVPIKCSVTIPGVPIKCSVTIPAVPIKCSVTILGVLIKIIMNGSIYIYSSRVQIRPRPSDFSGRKILNTPSFGREVKPFVPCRRFAACKIPECYVEVGHFQAKFIGHFSPK